MKDEYLIISIGKTSLGFNADYAKTDILPINYLRIAERMGSGLFILRKQIRTRYSGGVIDHMLLPVYLAGILNEEEGIDHKNALYILIKRSYSGLPRFYKENGERKELNLSLAFIVNDKPEIISSENMKFENSPSSVCPKVMFCDDNIIPILDVKAALKTYTKEFCDLYPELAEYYPFSEKFKFR